MKHHPHDKEETKNRQEMMSRRQLLSGIGAAAFISVLPKEGWTLVKQAEKNMASRAISFLDTLSPAKRRQAVFSFEDKERLNWHFIPRSRRGIALKEMNDHQRRATHALLRSGLSETGYEKAINTMKLEGVLRRIETFGFFRDPENYLVSIFGSPKVLPWGWRFEGHHLSLNFTAVTDEYTAVTPAFFGSNPSTVPIEPLKGLKTLGREEDMGRELIRSLDPSMAAKAIISDQTFGDILAGPGRAAALKKPSGLPLSDVPGSVQDLAVHLIKVYTGNIRDDLAQFQLNRIRANGIGKICFAWAGAVEPGRPHYYRLHGPTFVIEYDNTQGGGTHIHSVIRDLTNDFGQDALAEHYKTGHHHDHHNHSA